MAEYSATRRTPRKHKRVVMKALSSLTLTVSNSSPETCRPTNNGNPTTTNASSANCRRIGPFLTSASRSWGALCAPQHCVSAADRLRKTQYRPKADSASYRTTAIIAPACCSSITLAAAPAALRTTPVGRCLPMRQSHPVCRHSSPWRSRPACNQHLRNRRRKPVSPDRRPIHRRRYWPSGLQSP